MDLGRDGERLARTYLENAGLEFRSANARSGSGELDLVMYDPTSAELVFVEVRARRDLRFGSPEDTLGPTKRRALVRSILGYVAKIGWSGHYRFDFVGIVMSDGEPHISHLRNIALF